MLGVSGLRGIVGKSLTPEVAARYAAAFGAWLRDRAGYSVRVCIGRDGRVGGEALQQAAMDGLISAGAAVSDLGVVATPTVGFTTGEFGFDGGMVVTASHNPQEWNGLKCIVADPDPDPRRRGRGASAPNTEQAAEIIGRFRDDPGPPPSARGSVERLPGATTSHLGHMFMDYTGLGDPEGGRSDRLGYRIVVDSVNCSGAAGARELLTEFLGCELVHRNSDNSGVFPHPAEPTKENLESLCSAVTKFGAQVGFAQDPDADRLAIVDEKGDYIGEEYTLALAARALLEGKEGQRDKGTRGQGGEETGKQQPVLVANLSTSRMIDDIAAKHGARVVRTPVGEANVVEAMKREAAAGHNVVLGGEGNGGVIWPRVTYVRDSLSAMALVLALMARTGETISQLVADIPTYAIEKRKVDLARKEDAAPAIAKLLAFYSPPHPITPSPHHAPRHPKVDLQDGVRLDWDGPLPGGAGGRGKAWLHVRASNTEPIMRLIAEAPTLAAVRAILDEAARVIGP